MFESGTVRPGVPRHQQVPLARHGQQVQADWERCRPVGRAAWLEEEGTSGESQLVGRRRKSLEDHGSNLGNKKVRKNLVIDLTDLTDTEDEE